MSPDKNADADQALAEIERQIARLNRSRENLESQRAALREEELKVLADAFARKLVAAGFTVREGLAALRPYAKGWSAAAADTPAVAAGPAFAPAAPQAAARAQRAGMANGDASSESSLRAQALQVLGNEGAGWMKRPHPLLGGQSPQQMAATPQGHEKVRALLAAYARGV